MNDSYSDETLLERPSPNITGHHDTNQRPRFTNNSINQGSVDHEDINISIPLESDNIDDNSAFGRVDISPNVELINVNQTSDSSYSEVDFSAPGSELLPAIQLFVSRSNISLNCVNHLLSLLKLCKAVFTRNPSIEVPKISEIIPSNGVHSVKSTLVLCETCNEALDVNDECPICRVKSGKPSSIAIGDIKYQVSQLFSSDTF